MDKEKRRKQLFKKLSVLGEVKEVTEYEKPGIFVVKIGKGFKNNFGSVQKVNEILIDVMKEYPYIKKLDFDERGLELVLLNQKQTTHE